MEPLRWRWGVSSSRFGNARFSAGAKGTLTSDARLLFADDVFGRSLLLPFAVCRRFYGKEGSDAYSIIAVIFLMGII